MPAYPRGTVDVKVGRRVRRWREARGLTQSALAGRDFTKGFISLVETGRARMSAGAATVIAKRLRVSLSTLREGRPIAPAFVLCTRCGGSGIDPDRAKP